MNGLLNHLIDAVSHIGHWAYPIIFAGVMLESAAFLGFVIPGEMLALLGGFLAGQGTLDWGDLMLLVCSAAILGDNIGYLVGRHVGRQRILRLGRWVRLRETHLQRVEGFFRSHGGKAVFLARFMALLRALMPFVAGSSRMRYWRFVVFDAAGAVLWGVGMVFTGYVVGSSWRLAAHWMGAATAVVAGLIVVVILLAWLWRWLMRRQALIRGWWLALIERPTIAALRRRFAPQTAFLIARLTPGGYLGLYLTVGGLVLIGASWMFGAIAEDVITGDTITRVDALVGQWLHTHATPGLTAFFRAVTDLGWGPVVAGIGAGLALWLSVGRRWYWLLDLVLAVPGGALLNVALKHIFRRPRPQFVHPLVQLVSYSFPSGHTVAATTLYGLIAIFALQVAVAWKWRTLTVLLMLLLVALIGFSRIYLGAHYLSDVLAAQAEGVAWLAICTTGVETLRRRRDGRPPSAA